jgi:Fe-S cluster biogenesis protein NfuA
MAQSRNVQEVGARVEELLSEFRSGADPSVSDRAEELVRVLMELYGSGLQRTLDLLGREPSGSEIVRRLAQDPLVASLLSLHGLHPVPVETRIAEALEGARRYLGGGEARLLGFDDDGMAHVKLEGNLDTCSSSPLGAKLAVEKAVTEAAPEITGVVVQMPPVPTPFTGGPVQIEIRPRPGPVPVEIGRKPR